MAHHPAWSRAAALAAGTAFVARTGRLPVSLDLRPASDLPSYNSVKDLFANLAGYHRALGAPSPPPPPTPPPEQQRRTCLKCDARFVSAHAGNRICGPCKRERGFADDNGDWMNRDGIRWD